MTVEIVGLAINAYFKKPFHNEFYYFCQKQSIHSDKELNKMKYPSKISFDTPHMKQCKKIGVLNCDSEVKGRMRRFTELTKISLDTAKIFLTEKQLIHTKAD